jgi:hypothetical protein
VDKLRRVPDAFRRFEVDPVVAEQLHRVTPPMLRHLLDLGLPHSGTGDGLRLDQLDLENVGLALRLPSPRWTAMRGWQRGFHACPRTGRVTHRLTIRTTCPDRRPHRCDLAVHPAAVAAGMPGTLRRNAGGFTLDLTATAVDHRFGHEFSELFGRVRPLEFHVLPRALGDDVRFAVDTGLADCISATKLLIHSGRELGLRIRSATGYLLMRPVITWHCWVELGPTRDGELPEAHPGDDPTEGWLAADPFMLQTFGGWRLADPTEWPVDRSPQGLLWRCGTRTFPLVTHRGEGVRAELTLGPRP